MNLTHFWWKAEEDPHESVFEYVRNLEEVQQWRLEQNIRLAKLYSNCDLPGLGWNLRQRPGVDWSGVARTSVNVIRSVVDTAASMIAKNRPKPTFVTDGGDFTTQRRAKLLEKFILGQFQKLEIYNKAVEVFRDAAVYGTGAMQVYDSGGEVCAERVPIDELVADELESRSCDPRQLHRRRFMDREVLRALYPDFGKQIDDAHQQAGGSEYTSFCKLESQMVVVIESWRLPSKPGADDGRHTICIETATLLDEVWTKDHFDIVFYRWSKPLVGFYGQGLAEHLVGKQIRINKLYKHIDDCQDLVAVPRVFVDHSSKVLESKMTNRIGEVIGYRGRPPTFYTATAVNGEVYQHLQQLIASCYEEAGISRLSATSRKPGGLESAVALREYNDIETNRFAINAQDYEQFHLDVARMIVGVGKDLFKGGSDHASAFRERNVVKRIKWSDVDMDEDMYQMQIEASSILTRSPAGRTQTVIEWAQAGIISQDEARRLLGHPDLERAQSLYNAAIEDIEATIEDMEAGIICNPEPYQNLIVGLPRVQQHYLVIRHENAPEEILELFRVWIRQAEQMTAPPPAPPALAAPGAEGMAPDAGGMPPQAAFSAQAQQLAPQ